MKFLKKMLNFIKYSHFFPNLLILRKIVSSLNQYLLNSRPFLATNSRTFSVRRAVIISLMLYSRGKRANNKKNVSLIRSFLFYYKLPPYNANTTGCTESRGRLFNLKKKESSSRAICYGPSFNNEKTSSI